MEENIKLKFTATQHAVNGKSKNSQELLPAENLASEISTASAPAGFNGDVSPEDLNKAIDEALKHNDFSQLFPTLKRSFHGRRLSFLDNASGALKPFTVAQAVLKYYLNNGSNAHRGVYQLSMEATSMIEESRKRLQKLLNAERPEEIIFTSGSTDSLNQLAQSLIRSKFLNEGDEIILTAMEHHANLIPWQRLKEENGVILKFVEVSDSGELKLEHFRSLLSKKTKLLSLVHISNSIGTINDINTLIKEAKSIGALTAVDCAQSIAHGGIDVQACRADFIVFSLHKMFGPTGLGVLYGRYSLLEQMPGVRLGGGGILDVTLEKTRFSGLPSRFEAGTANIAGLLGVIPAINFIESLGMDRLLKREEIIINYALKQLQEIRFLRLVGRARKRAAVFSFVIDGVHAHDAGSIFDDLAVAVRVGHHCTQPLLNRLGFKATIRASFSCFNTLSDVDRLVEGIYKAKEVFSS